MEDALDSGTTQPGDHFTATLLESVIVGDRVALAAGSTIEGTVTDVVPASKGIKDSGGSLTLNFEKILTPTGETAPMAASFSQVAKSTKKKAGTIGGAAAGGALLGKIIGGSTKDAAVGAVVGGAIGTGVAAGTKGTEMKIEAGKELTITLDQPVTVHLKR
jgi:preprotein translocase subunit YajC